MNQASVSYNNSLYDAKSTVKKSRKNLPYPDHEPWALFLDIDGSIADIAPSPQTAFIPNNFLQSINHLKDGALALISGRDIRSIDRLTHPHYFAIAGQHGLELRGHDGRVFSSVPVNGALEKIDRSLAALQGCYPGILIERKGAGVAVHYRAVPEKAGDIRHFIELLMERHGDDFCLEQGKMVTEVRFKGADKGTAITYFMQAAPFAGKLPVFVGDDITDEAGFNAVNRMGGISIKVGEGYSAASFRIDTPEKTRNWLHEIVSLLHPASRRVP